MIAVDRPALKDTRFGGAVPGIKPLLYPDGNLIPVVDPAIGHLIAYKDREVVHQEGDFHLGVQAYIVREGENGKIEVLMQKRSEAVDISKGRHDQSLATQLLAKDNGNLKAALKRGLMEELDIRENEIEIASVGEPAELRIYKKYEEDPKLYNREYIYLYFVKVSHRNIRSSNPKVAGVEWMEWKDFVAKIKKTPGSFAKTARFYVMNPTVLEETEKALIKFIKGEPVPDSFPIRRAYYYGYPGRYDIFISVYQDQSTQMHVYDYANDKVSEIEDVHVFDPYEGKDRKSVAVRITKKNGRNFIWENGLLTPTGLLPDPFTVQVLEKISANMADEIALLEKQARGDEEEKLVLLMRHKFNHDLNALRSRVLAGEMVFFQVLPGDKDGVFKIKNAPKEAVIITIPGTLDPPHFAHVELLLDALVYESEKARGKRMAYALFLTPIGGNAPGPNGESWKSAKTDFKAREEMCQKTTDILYPLLQTSRISFHYDSDPGTKNAMKILNSMPKKNDFNKIHFVVAVGSDTYRKWGSSMRSVIEQEKNNYPGARFKILIRDSWQDPLEKEPQDSLPKNVELLKGLYSLPIRSTAIRQGELNLIAAAVKRFIQEKKLYSV